MLCGRRVAWKVPLCKREPCLQDSCKEPTKPLRSLRPQLLYSPPLFPGTSVPSLCGEVRLLWGGSSAPHQRQAPVRSTYAPEVLFQYGFYFPSAPLHEYRHINHRSIDVRILSVLRKILEIGSPPGVFPSPWHPWDECHDM